MPPELDTYPALYTQAFPNFGRPRTIGYIGLENLMYARRIQNKDVNFDLNLHIEKAIRKPQNIDVKLHDLLNFLLEHEKRLNYHLENNLKNAKIFCYRGLLRCVACTPYENKEPWKIAVILFKGNIFLCLRDTEEKISQKNNMTDQEKKFTSWGYKFEQYMLSENPHTEPNPDIPLDETKEFSIVFTTTLNEHTIVYGAEMDGIRCDKAPVPPAPTDQIDNILQYLSDKEFIELKTSRHIEFAKQHTNFRRYKTIKWWCQSFLANINTIVCGFRNDDGIVEKLKVYPIDDLAKMSQKFWKPNVCFNFLDTFFIFVKRCLSRKIRRQYGDKALNHIGTLPLISLMLEWRPGMPIQISESYNHEDDPILSQYFIENYGKSNNASEENLI